MTVPMFELTAGVAMRSSPTMSAANLAKEAEKTGRKVDVVTLGDLFPKPSKQETTEWLDRLKQDAANPANKGDEAFALRPDARTYAYSETTGLPSLRAAVAKTFHPRHRH